MQHGMDALSASLNADVRAVRQELEERASELEEASKSGSNTVEQDVRALEYRGRGGGVVRRLRNRCVACVRCCVRCGAS